MNAVNGEDDYTILSTFYTFQVVHVFKVSGHAQK